MKRECLSVSLSGEEGVLVLMSERREEGTCEDMRQSVGRGRGGVDMECDEGG